MPLCFLGIGILGTLIGCTPKPKAVQNRSTYLDTFVVEKNFKTEGEQITVDFCQSIRGELYIAHPGDQRSRRVAYSPYLQGLTTGDKITGWFQDVSVTYTVDNTTYTISVPLEIIQVNHKVALN